MKKDWQDRLKKAVDEDARSMRRICLDAGLGVNYLEQTFNRGSAPTQDKLAKVLDQLGEEAAVYVYTGAKLDAATIAFLQDLGSAPDAIRRSVLALMKSLSAELSTRGEENPLPSSALDHQESAKD